MRHQSFNRRAVIAAIKGGKLDNQIPALRGHAASKDRTISRCAKQRLEKLGF